MKQATLKEAPTVLNINDRAMWVLGHNEAMQKVEPEVAELIEAWRTSPLRSHDGRLFDAVNALAEAYGIDLAAVYDAPSVVAPTDGLSDKTVTGERK